MEWVDLAGCLDLSVEKFKELVSLFFESGLESLRGLKKSLEQKNAVGVSEALHDIKGGALNLGLTEFYRTVEAIEKELTGKSWNQVARLCGELEHSFSGLRGELADGGEKKNVLVIETFFSW